MREGAAGFLLFSLFGRLNTKIHPHHILLCVHSHTIKKNSRLRRRRKTSGVTLLSHPLSIAVSSRRRWVVRKKKIFRGDTKCNQGE